jgi:hypothetical protein
MDQQTARNGLFLISRGADFIPMNAKEAIAWNEFVNELQRIATSDEGSSQSTAQQDSDGS